MFSPARVGKAGYVLGLFTAILALLWPNPSSGQFRVGMPAPRQRAPQNFLPLQGMMGGGMGGLGGAMMGIGGGGMNMGGIMGAGGVSPLQRQLLAEFGALPVNGMNAMGGGMMGMGGGGMMGAGGVNPLQLQLLAEFGALPVNGSISGMGSFAGKTFGGFNGGKGF